MKNHKIQNCPPQIQFFKVLALLFFYSILISCKDKIEQNVENLDLKKFQVKESELKNITSTFLSESKSFKNKGAKVLANTDSTKKEVSKVTEKRNSKNELLLYIIEFKKNINKSGGYIVVSGDKRVEPVLAYSETDKYDESNLGLMSIIEDYIKLIEYAKKTFKEPKPKIKELWNNYEKSKGGKILSCPYYDPNCCPTNTYNTNGPLLNTVWDQSWPYNIDSPSRACGPVGKAYAGCGPIAISQVMNYYTQPNIRSQFNITGNPKPVLNPALSFPFDNGYNAYYGDTPNLSANQKDRGRFIKWVGGQANTYYYFFLNITNSAQNGQCASLTPRNNICDPFQAAGYTNKGTRSNYLSNLQTISNELYSGRPVIMDGTTAALAFSFWHIWVIDGIQESQYWSKDYTGTCNLAAYTFFHHNFGDNTVGAWCGVSNIIFDGANYDTALNATFNIRP